MGEINKYGEIIRDGSDSGNIVDSTIPIFTPPKMELSHANKGDEILHTGKYEYKGTKYDLKTLENLAQRLENEIRAGNDEAFYSAEILTIAMQMLKKAQSEVLESSQVTPSKEQKLKQIKDKQCMLQKDGILLNTDTLLREPEKAQKYITALQEEMAKQEELDAQTKMEETTELARKMPNISAQLSTVDTDER